MCYLSILGQDLEDRNGKLNGTTVGNNRELVVTFLDTEQRLFRLLLWTDLVSFRGNRVKGSGLWVIWLFKPCGHQPQRHAAHLLGGSGPVLLLGLQFGQHGVLQKWGARLT